MSNYSSPSFAFCAAMAWAADDTPGTVPDCRKEIDRFAATVFEFLLITGLFGGIGGATRATLEFPNVDFFTGGWGAPWTLCARIIVATFDDPVAIGDEFGSWRSTWPGDIDRAIPVAKIK